MSRSRPGRPIALEALEEVSGGAGGAPGAPATVTSGQISVGPVGLGVLYDHTNGQWYISPGFGHGPLSIGADVSHGTVHPNAGSTAHDVLRGQSYEVSAFAGDGMRYAVNGSGSVTQHGVGFGASVGTSFAKTPGDIARDFSQGGFEKNEDALHKSAMDGIQGSRWMARAAEVSTLREMDPEWRDADARVAATEAALPNEQQMNAAFAQQDANRSVESFEAGLPNEHQMDDAFAQQASTHQVESFEAALPNEQQTNDAFAQQDANRSVESFEAALPADSGDGGGGPEGTE